MLTSLDVAAIRRRIVRVFNTTRMLALVYVHSDGTWWVSYDGPKDAERRRRFEARGDFAGAYDDTVSQERLFNDLMEHQDDLRKAAAR